MLSSLLSSNEKCLGTIIDLLIYSFEINPFFFEEYNQACKYKYIHSWKDTFRSRFSFISFLSFSTF